MRPLAQLCRGTPGDGGAYHGGSCPKGCHAPPHFDPSGHRQLGAGLVMVSRPHGLSFSSLVDGHRDRAPSLLLLGAERACPGVGGGRHFLPPLSGLQPPFPHLSLSLCVCLSPTCPSPVSLIFLTLLPSPTSLPKAPCWGRVTLFPVALLCSRDSRAAGARMGDSVTGKHSRAGPAKRPSPEGGGIWHGRCWFQTLAAHALPQADDITGWLSLVKCRGDMWPASLVHCLQVGLCCSLPAG